MTRWNVAPRSIALNYSESDPAADGLPHGLWRVLQDTLAETPYPERFASSEAIVNALRGRKSPTEVERIRRATLETEEIFDVVTAALAPGQSESRSPTACTVRSNGEASATRGGAITALR